MLWICWNLRILFLSILLHQPVIVKSVWTDFDLVRPWTGAWGSTGTTPYLKISGIGESNSVNGSRFGSSVSNIGDLNMDGIPDLAVGAIGEGVNVAAKNLSLVASGSVYILFMNGNGSVRSHTKITGHLNGGPLLKSNDRFGYSLCKWKSNILAVGAPGTNLGAIYLLHLHRNGSMFHYNTIRGHEFGNGPPIAFGSSFGSSIANIGDLNSDGVPDLAVGAGNEGGGGNQLVYILFMNANGTVLKYTSIGNNVGGGPSLSAFSFFGSAVLNVGDLNGDGVTDIAVGARWTRDVATATQKGAVFVCFLRSNGSALRCIEHNAEMMNTQTNDNCGASLANIGDVNRDDLRARHFPDLHIPARNQIPDIIVGCPQSASGVRPGRVLAMYMTKEGLAKGYGDIPSRSLYFPSLPAKDRFGSALANYSDIDRNGINEIVVGAPGDRDGGAIYILFLRRRRYHPTPFDLLAYYLTIFVPVGTVFCLMFWSCVAFCYCFRRRKTEVEIAVEKAGVETGVERKRVKHKKATKKDAYVDHYFE